MTEFGKSKVLLVLPNGLQAVPNECSRTWNRADWHADPRTVDLEQLERRSGSLVDSFNTLWATARNYRDHGKADYFAMCHADIEPGSWWINDLLSEMRLRNASVCSAVVAIKDHGRKLTSAAIGKVDDRYEHRCLTLDDLDKLPGTFDTEQCCQPGELLVINTGLWICDLRQSWVDEWVFPQTCEIVRDAKDQRWVSRLVTEDWEMSRFLLARGGRYVCTRKVVTRHWGFDYWEVGPRKWSFPKS